MPDEVESGDEILGRKKMKHEQSEGASTKQIVVGKQVSIDCFGEQDPR